MPSSSLAVVCLQVDACPAVIGALWAAASTAAPHDRTQLLHAAAQIQVEQCRTLGVDPAVISELLVGLPPLLRRDVRDHLSREVQHRAGT